MRQKTVLATVESNHHRISISNGISHEEREDKKWKRQRDQRHKKRRNWQSHRDCRCFPSPFPIIGWRMAGPTAIVLPAPLRALLLVEVLLLEIVPLVKVVLLAEVRLS